MGLLLLGWCGCHGAAEALAEILHARSDWWPQQVRLAQPYTPPGAAAPLPAGWQAVLVRVEGAEVVADFGRHGIRRLPLEDTDVLQQAAALRDQPPRRHGLLVTSLFNKFFHLEQDRAVQCKLQDFAGVEYVLFVYTDPCGAEGRAALKELRRFLAGNATALHGLRPVVIPADCELGRLTAEVTAAGLPWPVMFPYLAGPYRHSLHHEPAGNPSLVLTDANGRILGRFDQRPDGPAGADFLQTIPGLLAADRAARKGAGKLPAND